MTSEFANIIAISVFVAGTFKYLYEVQAFLNRLKEQHKALWHSMGSPRLKFHFGDPSYRKAMGYIRSGEFRSLDDEVLEKHYRCIKRLEVVGIIVFMILVLLPLLELL